MKFSMKRVAALLLALVMVIGLLPVMNNVVDAVDVSGSLTDKSVGLSYATSGSPNANTSGWSANGNAITGNLQGVKRAAIYMNATSTLTITNNKSAAANLSFDYSTTTLNGGSATIDGQTATSGSFTKKLAAGESVEIVLSVSRTTGNKDNAMSISITNLILASASSTAVTTTFEAPAFGSYTVAYGSESLTVAAGTSSQTASNLPSVSYTFTANPGTGYKFVGWYNVTTDKYLGTDLSYTGSFEADSTVKAVIVPADIAVFMVGTNYYADLNEAIAYAQSNNLKQITLVQSGILAAGSYTIPAGITLLVPMDTEYTPTRTDDEDFGVAPEFTTEYTTPYAYLTLTMADGAKLTVNGTLDVESRHTSLQGGKTTGGRPCGAYGAIYMNPNAAITINNGANVYAWGYIYGEGTVTANSGAKVYEIMQVTDFPGGSNMSLFVDTDPTYDVDGDGNPSNDYFKTFPFSQYYVQNIEVELTLKAGAAEYVYITMTAGGQSMGLPVRFIGEGGMFVPGEGGTIVKDYDPSTDRLNVDVNGDASMAGIALDLSGTKYEGAVEDVLGTSKVDSASFILTLNGNITININSGITTVKQDLSLLPGVEINIAEEATLVVAERTYADGEYDNLTVYGTYTGYNIYVWDMDNWGNYVFKNKPLSALTYSPTTGRYVRTSADLKDVVIDINGTVICEGYIYSTVKFDDELWVPVEGAGAAVISTGKTGTLVLQNGPGPEDMAYCLDGYSDKDSAVFVDSVWLLNGDGSYVLTEGCEPGTTYGYCDVHDLWYTEGHGNCVVVNTVEITWVINGVGAPEEYLLGETPFYKGATPTKPTHVCTVYTFAGWATSPNGEVLAELPAVSGEATYFAIFTESQAHAWNAPDCENDGYCVKCGAPGEKAEGHVWRDRYSEYNGDGTHTDTFECEKCFELKEEIVECTNGKDDKAHACDVCFAELTTCKDSNQDHKCDICFERLSSCVDNSKDHYCDYAGCGAQLSSCVDSNNDHYCDYNGCRNVMSSCKDDNNDHRCDYNGCRKTLSSCVDVDDDHYCDFSGCRVQLTSCEDNDEDHFCDYLGCGEELTECEDSDENHYCDYAGCEYKMTDCVDTDGNHYCDFSGCDQKVTGCVDENLDHICDSEGCGIKVSNCADRDQNHYCDYAGCNEKRSNCVDNNQDHKCDFAGCMVKMSECVDGNKDHRCDYSGCKDKLTNCTDGNFDHYCDYSGCKDKMSNCTDGNDDHYCDYSGCNKKLSECVDADDNHYCDYAGCNEKLSDCDDADEDHYCDYAGCGEELTTCVDADEDHFCDYAGCGAELTSCKDNDQDHNCDYAGCGAGMSICVDSDEDHYCDFTGCREKISFCYDENQDHYCDYAKCGEKLSDCKDDNQNHKCDFTGCNAVLSSCVDANKDHQCDFESCNMKLSNCEDNDEDHCCDYAGCKDIVSACEDSNEDHYCDYAKCGKQLSDCCDDNDNHYCDYVGCGAKLSECTPGEEDEFILLEAGCEDGEKQIIVYCALCGEVYSEEYVPIPALGHGHSEGWEYIQIDNDVHQVWCADCWGYTYDEGHSYANHVCVDCGWTEMMSIKFYNGDALWRETSTPYGGKLGIGGMPIPAAPTGYQFAGWYTENDVKVVHGMTVTENIVAYATWSKLSYTITWNVDGIVTTEPYEYGATPSFKGNTDKAADGCTTYTFTGWDKDFAPVTGPVTYTAQYQTGISHTGEVKYTNNGNGTHNGTYDCCGTAYVTNEAHIYVDGVCACGAIEHVCADNLTFHTSVTPNCQNGGNNAYYSCSCGKFYADANASTEIAENSWILGKDSTNHTGTVGYTNNGADHTAAYSCCGESWNENHTYVNGTCVCDALKVSKLTFIYGASGEYKIELMVPYGTRLFDVVDFDVVTANMYVHSADRWGYYEQSGFYGCFDNSGNLGYLYYFGENYTMPDCDFYIEARYVYNGFIHDGIGWQYIKGEHLYKDVLMGVMMGDLYEGGSFEEFEGLYAFDENGYRIENGLFRDYYIGEWINGVTYEPNAEDIAYYESKGMTFIDAEQTWYYFGADGKWAYNYTGRFGNSYIVNGHAAWHVGLVEIEGDYYYFKGDEVNGGNIMVIGDYYISRNNTDKDVVIGGLYTFGADGKLCWYNGITEVNGVLRYYEDARLMLGNGLTQVGENFIYVNSYGNLVVDAEYYIGANSFGIAKGIYYFDANGFLVIPEEEPAKEGLFFEDGKWFYYVDGAKAYCAGLIQINGNWVYVRSDGSLATGTYYVTNTNGHATIASGTKCTFDDNGIMIDPVLGEQVLEEGGIRDKFNVRTEVTLKSNGKLTIDVSNISMVTDDQYLGFDVEIYGADGSYYNEIVRGEGVAEFDLSAGEYVVYIYIAWFDGVDDDEPGYGRGSLDYKITFTSDGTPLNGIVDGYYYVDGHIAYAAGLIEIDGIYYYVRSNGQIVTDCQYWITNVNDTGYEPGLYEFDADGWMHKIYVETFTGIKDGYYYIDDEVAYAAGLVQYNGGYIYVRSNGQVATGKYWITNHNDLLPAGFYDFGEDGYYYPAIPENAHLLMEVDKNVDTDGFWDSNAIANAVRASADGNLYIEVTDVTFEYESAGKGGFCIEFEGSYWVMQWDAVYKVGTGTVMIPVSAGEDVILFVNPADVCEDYVDSVYGTISYKVWSDVECELVQGGIGE